MRLKTIDQHIRSRTFYPDLHKNNSMVRSLAVKWVEYPKAPEIPGALGEWLAEATAFIGALQVSLHKNHGLPAKAPLGEGLPDKALLAKSNRGR
ncbi:hypothetical protein [Chitinophaga rhizosphaerae]|uniref:hypothetical protein n=1 Tax=Chitinophaga rhizosphaerae TaxID=1864947 RepID=UPI000F805370|nr:hypothetical protein [Chitinophaga rhizosphaerae]